MVKASIKARLSNQVPRIFPSASGCLAIPSTACPAAVPCPTPGPIEASPTANPAAITEAAEISGFIVNEALRIKKERVNDTINQ
jgi:hypothetical protein